MVAAKQGNKRRGGSMGGVGGGPKPGNNRRFKPGPNDSMRNGRMFQASQIPDNPGYLDFNDPPQINASNMGNRNNDKVNKGGFRRGGGSMSGPGPSRGMGGGGANKPRGNIQTGGNRNNNNWGNNNRNNMSRNNSNNRRGDQRGNNNMQSRQMGPPNRMGGPRMGGGRGPMGPPPIGMMGGPMPPIPPPNFMPSRLGPGPMGPPPMMGPPIPPLGPPRGPPRPMQNRRMGMRSDNPVGNNSGPGPIRRAKNIVNNRKNLKNRKGGAGTAAAAGGGGPSETTVNNNAGRNRPAKRLRVGSSKKTLKEIINQYSLDKPWVTDEIKAEAKIKENIENRLKGKKDDKLFAEFKVQRDKFVALYDAAKKEHVEKNKKKDNNEMKTLNESDKEKGANNANTAATT